MTAKVLEAQVVEDVEAFLAAEAELSTKMPPETDIGSISDHKEDAPRPVVGARTVYIGAAAMEFPGQFDGQLLALRRKQAARLGRPLTRQLLGR